MCVRTCIIPSQLTRSLDRNWVMPLKQKSLEQLRKMFSRWRSDIPSCSQSEPINALVNVYVYCYWSVNKSSNCVSVLISHKISNPQIPQFSYYAPQQESMSSEWAEKTITKIVNLLVSNLIAISLKILLRSYIYIYYNNHIRRSKIF